VTDSPRVANRSSMASTEGLVGRKAELALVTAAVRELGEGRASVLVIQGEAGIGKTRLVESIVDDARSRGATVFRGEAHPFEHTRPFGVLAAALGLRRRPPDAARAAIAALLADKGVGAPGDVQYRVVEAIVDLVETASAERPVLFVAEDLQWADGASLLAMLSLVRQLPLASLLVVVTARPSPLPAEVVRLLDDLAAGGARTLHLDPLKPDELAVLTRQRVGAPPGPRLTEMLARTGGNPLWAVALLRSLADAGMLHRVGDSVEPTTFELPDSLSDLVVRRLRHLPTATLDLLEVTAVLGDAVSLRDVAAVSGRPPAQVVGQLRDAFDARLLDEAGDRVVFRHQLVHDAVYQHMPPPSRRLLHREAAVALMGAGADRLDVAHHLMLGAEPGDEQAVAWLREAADEASAQAPSVTVELLRRAEALLPDGHRDADLVSSELVQALLRAGQVPEASARAEAMLAQPHAAEVDTSLRLALVGAFALQNRAVELIDLVESSLAGSGLRPAEQALMLAQQSWALTYGDDPRAGEAAAGRALTIAQQAGDAAMTVWASTALLVAVGRQGRYGEALAHARRAAAMAAGPRDTRSLPLQPRFFLGLALADCDLIDEARAAFRAALEDEFGAAWWLSDTLMADAQAAFVIGEWDDALPGLVAGGQAAQEKGHQLLVSQSLAYRTVIATARGDLQAAAELAAPIAASLQADRLSYNAGILAFAVAGLRAAEGDQPAPTTCCCAAGGSTRGGTTATTTGVWRPTSSASRWSSVIVTSPPRWPTPSRQASPSRPRCPRCAAWHCAAGVSSTTMSRRCSRRSHWPERHRCSSSTPAPARTPRHCWPVPGGETRPPRCCPKPWIATSRPAPTPGPAASGRGCGPSAPVPARAVRGSDRHAAGRASPRPSRRCRSSSPRDSPTVPSPSGCTSRHTPSTPTSATCSRSWASPTGSSSPPRYIARTSDVSTAAKAHRRVSDMRRSGR
jgi:tetratricopeptide (TPR) repeat protein